MFIYAGAGNGIRCRQSSGLQLVESCINIRPRAGAGDLGVIGVFSRTMVWHLYLTFGVSWTIMNLPVDQAPYLWM